MNAIVSRNLPATLTMSEDKAIQTLQDTLYPGAKAESVAMVLAWCRATGRDPMKKPVHLVPMSVKNAATGKWEWRDVVMPGIGTYRTDAARTGEYVGKTEPEFGADVTTEVGDIRMTYPRSCKVTVSRLIHGIERKFTAVEFWVENYATAGKDTANPNTMWKKRPYGQLAKCTEAQALRMAFPDETGNTNTMEEMEGKTFDGVTIEAAPEQQRRQPVAPAISRPSQPTLDQTLDGDTIPDFDSPPPPKLPTPAEWINGIINRISAMESAEEYNDLQQDLQFANDIAAFKDSFPKMYASYDAIRQVNLDRIAEKAAISYTPVTHKEEMGMFEGDAS